METVVLTIHLILALSLVAVVLLQRSEGGGLGMGAGGVMTGRGQATALGRVTWWLAGAFIATSVALTAIAARDAAGSSVVDQINAAPGAVEGGEADDGAGLPGLGEGSLLPPPAGEDPPLVPDAAPAPDAVPATE